MVSHAWKSLSPEQRLVWEDMSNKDKERFEREKVTYTGPWKVLAGKDHTAPKRPASAFCKYIFLIYSF
jgi:HMG (high mobility group) box